MGDYWEDLSKKVSNAREKSFLAAAVFCSVLCVISPNRNTQYTGIACLAGLAGYYGARYLIYNTNGSNKNDSKSRRLRRDRNRAYFLPLNALKVSDE